MPESVCQEVWKKHENVICIDSIWKASNYTRTYRNADGTARIEIAKPPLHCGRPSFTFEPASPYAERFAEVQQKIQESGISYILRMRSKFYEEEGAHARAIRLNTEFDVSGIAFIVELLISGTIKRVLFPKVRQVLKYIRQKLDKM